MKGHVVNFITRIWRSLAVGGHLLREIFQIMYGQYKILRLPQPTVSIFGGARLPQDGEYTKKAFDLAGKLAYEGFSVLTGGGPGIMESANCGANKIYEEHRTKGMKNGKNGRTIGHSMGIGISRLRYEEKLNNCVSEKIMLDYFFARKYLLLNYSKGFVVFPGGLGTMDELSDLLNLMQTGKRPFAPVVLIGAEFWKCYREWVTTARKAGLLSQSNEPRVLVTDNLDEAVALLVEHSRSLHE
jgi:uncharacterized protein (TIGR00730 family)